MLESVVFHADCNKLACRHCMAASEALNRRLEELLPDWLPNLDLAGHYHKWMTDNGNEPETDGGWWSQAALDPANVQAFADFKNKDIVPF